MFPKIGFFTPQIMHFNRVCLLYIIHFGVPLFLEIPIYQVFGNFSSQLPIYQVTIDPWFQIYRELEDQGNASFWSFFSTWDIGTYGSRNKNSPSFGGKLHETPKDLFGKIHSDDLGK